MRADDSRGGAVERAEAEEVGEPARTFAVSEGFRDLECEERAQEISLRRLFAEQDHRLRQKYADWIIWLLGVQFVVADTVFVVFSWVGQDWDLPPDVIEVWLAATVVQVVGVVAIVTRHFFPGREANA